MVRCRYPESPFNWGGILAIKRLGVCGAFGVLLLCPGFAAAIDSWDQTAGHMDDNSGTDNELTNGSEQLHDLQAVSAVVDQDWYLVGQQPYSSYEVVVDGLTEEVASIPASEAADHVQLDLVNNAGVVATAGSASSSIGAARSLRFRNATPAQVASQYVRVMSGTDGCEAACTANAQYRIVTRETTLLLPRFNNAGTQTTILMLQNASGDAITATARFWSGAGVLLGSSSAAIPGHGVWVLPTQTVTGAAGVSGSGTIDHTGRYGAIVGKAVALEPSTGFTFDTAVVPKAY